MPGISIRNFANASGGVFYNGAVPYDSTGAILVNSGLAISAEGYGALPSATGAANYTAIQAALNAANAAGGGVVTLMTAGTYSMAGKLVIYSNTDFVCSDGVVIQSTAGTNLSMITNSALAAATSNITLTWSSGTALQINWTAHGRSVGDYVSVAGATPVAFNGVFRVKTVTDANTIQVDMYRDPTFIGHISATNGSAAISFQTAPSFSLAGYSLVSSDAATVYTISAHTKQTTSATLSGNYSGTTSTNFTRMFRAYKAPVAVSGSITAKACDVNINIINGRWNYNYTGGNNAAGQSPDRHAIVLGFIANSSVRGIVPYDGNKYLVNVGAVANVTIDSVFSPQHRSDIVKVYGPAYNAQVRNISGVSGDDGVSFQGIEPAGFIGYTFSNGDILNCSAENLEVEHSGGQGACTLYGSDEEIIDQIRVTNVVGFSSTAGNVVIGNGSGFIGRFGRVLIDKVGGTVTGATAAAVTLQSTGSGEASITVQGITAQAFYSFLAQSSPTVRELIIRDCTPRDLGAAGTPIRLNGIIAKRVSVEGCTFENLAATTSGYLISCEGTSSIGLLEVKKNFTPMEIFFLALDCALTDVVVDGNSSQGLSSHFVRVNSNCTGTPTIRIVNNTTNTLAAFNPNVSCDVFFSGNRFSGATNGVVRTGSTPTVPIRSAGNNLVSGTWVVVPSGTPVLTVYGWDITIDPAGLTGLATTNGQFCTSNNATAAKQGPAVRAFSINAWYALATGAAGVNTAI